MCDVKRGGPRTPSRTTDPNLDCAFVKNALVFVVWAIGVGDPLGPPLYDPPDTYFSGAAALHKSPICLGYSPQIGHIKLSTAQFGQHQGNLFYPFLCGLFF